MAKLRFRRVISLTSLTSFLLVGISGCVLFLAPQGRVAYWADWRLWGLGKDAWTAVHINLAFLFLLASLLHLYENWGPLTSYLKDRRKRLVLFTGESTLALVLAVVFAAGTLLGVVPLSSVIALGDRIKERHAQTYGLPPYGHAELSTLSVFARRTGLNADRAVTLLEARGLRGVAPDRSLARIARDNGMSPQQVHELIREAAEAPPGSTVGPPPPRPGMGRLSIAEAAEAYNFNVKTALSRLAAKGASSSPETTLKEAADRAGLTPSDLLVVLVR